MVTPREDRLTAEDIVTPIRHKVPCFRQENRLTAEYIVTPEDQYLGRQPLRQVP